MHVPVALSPQARQGNPKNGCLGCLGLIGIIFVIGMIISAFSGGSHDSGSVAVRHTEGGYIHKAVASESKAAQIANMSDDDRAIYHKGLQHIYNQHGKLGSFTIGQVIDQERSREKARKDIASQAEEQRKAAREAAHEQAVAKEEARYMHGTPQCLVMVKDSVHTSSGDYTWYIDGKVINKCDRDLRYAQVSFNFYDSAGNMQNSGLININNLEAGATWAFHKAVYESNTDGGGTFRVEKIEGF
jgi:hypothetical protein